MRDFSRTPRQIFLALAGTIMVAAVSGCSTTVMDLKPGDCLNLPSELDLKHGAEFSLSAVERTECDKPHQAEVIHSFDVATSEDEDFPGVDTLWERAQEVCTTQFENYVGSTLENSTLELMPMLPSEESWKQNADHTGLCVAYLSEGKVSTTFKNFK